MKTIAKVSAQWDAMTHDQRIAIADRWITNESNLMVWDKPFNELSTLKQKRVITSLNARQIIIVSPGSEPWGNFKKLCKDKGWPYHSLKGKKFPIKFGEFTIEKKKVM